MDHVTHQLEPEQLEEALKGLKALTSAVRTIAHGDDVPTGLEAMSMSITGQHFGLPLSEAVQSGLSEIATAISDGLSEIASAIKGHRP
jgi:hypothetical protein